MRYWLTLILLCLSVFAQAQQSRGRIIASKVYTPVSDVLVANKRTAETVYTDSSGRYAINAIDGDMLFFYRLGYSSHREVVRIINGEISTVVLKPSDLTLDEVQVKGSTYKMDSTERSIVYHKAMNDANEKVKMSIGTGIAFEGLIGRLASKLTGREKRVQHFKRTFVQGERDRFIATRYTTLLVNQITGLTGDNALIFIDAFPMPYEFARAASDLELQMWVRNNYKQYTNKPKDKQ